MAEQTIIEDNLDCCIAGGGPAGMMLGFLLARAGLKVVVLEKHKDFFRDFRGDTIHPSVFQAMEEMGLLQEFLKVPHQEIQTLQVVFNGSQIDILDLGHLPVSKPVVGLMPQWDFLNFIAKCAERYPGFQLRMETNAIDVIVEQGRVTGVIVETSAGPVNIKAKLVVATDGRNSTLRAKAGLKVINTGVPIDVLWFRLSFKQGDPPQSFGRFLTGNVMVLINRGDYWQCAFIIEKNGLDVLKEKGLENFRQELAQVSPFLADRLNELKSWDDMKLLTVVIDHLEKWYTDGLLCIGDAAHAMSPVGGVGINLAIQDAIAAANILYPHLTAGTVDTSVLKQVQQRREWPTRMIQRIQVLLHNGIVSRRKNRSDTSIPLFLKMLNTFPILRRIPARIVGLGIRPEHVKMPDANSRLRM